jgi:hypothetical protein
VSHPFHRLSLIKAGQVNFSKTLLTFIGNVPGSVPSSTISVVCSCVSLIPLFRASKFRVYCGGVNGQQESGK